jgi:hypothetical protein
LRLSRSSHVEKGAVGAPANHQDNEIDVSEIDIDFDFDFDFTNVGRYQAKLEHAWQEYLASQDSRRCRHTRKRSTIASSEEQLRYFLVVIFACNMLTTFIGYSLYPRGQFTRARLVLVAAITVHDSSSVCRKHKFCRGLRYLSMRTSTSATVMTFVGAGFFVVCKNRRARGLPQAWTNMAQPFWALPALAIAGLGVRDIMDYCVTALLLSGVIFVAGMYLF